MKCPDANALAALAEAGDMASFPELALHLASCPACARELEQVRASLETGQEEEDPFFDSRLLWKKIASGAANGIEPATQSPALLRWAAAVLLALAAGLAHWAHRESSSTPVSGVPARAATAASPSWLLEPGRPAGDSFVYLGGIRGSLSPGTRLQALATAEPRFLLECGEAYLDIPPGVSGRILIQGGAEARVSGGALWAGIQTTSQPLAGAFLRAALAADSPGTFRVWAESGQIILHHRDGRGGKEEVLPPGATARWQEGQWIREQEGTDSIRLRALSLKASLPVWRETPWSLTEGATPLPRSGWHLDARTGRARLASSSPPAQGLLTVSLSRPEPRSELRIIFPQAGGSRAWRLGDWASRGLGKSASLTVAYGPWGARADADGNPLWSMTPEEVAKALPLAEGGAGISLEGESIDLANAVLREIP